jgi:hypothetical protein
MRDISRVFPVFGVVFVLSYALWFVAADRSLFTHNALFAYYPALGEFHWNLLQAPLAKTGPVMLWYGWIANSVIAGAVAAAIALLLPAGRSAKLWSVLVWTAPILSFLVLCYFERLWFIR